MQAYNMPFSKVIDIGQGAREHFHVPKYQREYAWGRKEWEQLLQDIEENDPGYVMAKIVKHILAATLVQKAIHSKQALNEFAGYCGSSASPMMTHVVYSRRDSLPQIRPFPKPM